MNFVLLTHQMTNVPSAALKVPIISVESLRDEIIAALDFLVTGI
jgi:toxin CcdB